MNQYLKTIQDLLQQNKQLSEQEKDAVIKAIADAEKQWSITDFKLDRTEKVKKTTAILLEETIAELEQKRKAVEAQNRELEIESALERVRSVAMGMKKPEDMLDVCKTISQQLELLHIKEIRNIQTAIFYEATSIYINYEFYRKHDKLLITEVDYDNHPVAQDFADRMTKGPNHVWTHEFKGEEVRDWLTFQKTTNVFIDSYLEKAISLNYYWYSLGPVALGISTYSPLNEEEINLFKRFRNVFELAYRRYIDIEKAQGQAREAQIELALERVRARTMAMQKSGELAETSLVLFQQFKDLGETSDQISIGIFNEDVMELYSTLYGSQWKEAARVDLNEPVVMKKIHKAWRDHKKSLVIDLAGKDLRKYNAFRKKLSNLEYKEDRWVIHIAFFSKGVLTFSTSEPHPQETIQLLERFAGVFDQTYTRFLDLQNAEAQAREAQIQLALERVRARTMAMQHSDELKNAAALLFQQVKSLGAPAYSCGYNIWEKYDKEFTSWMSTQDGSIINGVPNIPLTEDVNFIRYVESKQNGEQFFVLELRGERMQEHYEYLKTIPAFKAYFEYAVSVGFDLPETQIHHLANFSQGNLLFITLEPCPEFHDVFKRFAAVFEQTYTRFLDLQKAEAQTREAQIEAGLERVRAKAMAMHSSENLAETIGVFYRELKLLSVTPIRCGVSLIDEETRIVELTTMNTTGEGDSIEIIGKLKIGGHPILDEIFEHWLTQKEYHPVLRGAEINEYHEIMRRQVAFPGYSNNTIQFGYFFMFKEGWVYAWNDRELLEGELEIYRRFTTVLSLTYKRYKDLQQAESNAREARIEAGLERVRARTMAMHNSEDVSTATATMFNELEKLNIQNFRGGILNIRLDQTMEVWSVNTLDDGRIIRAIGDFDMTMHPFWRQLYQGWINKDESFLFDMSGKDKEDYIRILDARRDYLPNGLQYLPDCIVQSYFFGEGAVWTFSLQPHSEEDKQVMKRFASVFSLTFRRYKDLQKAEAQAREAQIEAALERVRARAMSMHKSDDLKGAVATVFEELDKLNLGLIRCGIAILDKEKPRGNIWVSVKSEQGNTIQLSGDEPLDYHPLLQGAYDSWLKQEDFSYALKGEELASYYRAVTKVNFQLPISATFDAEIKDQNQFYFNAVFQDGSLFAFLDTAFTDEAKTVMKRFANVFNLTYKRFLDLQKAEAQAREATIEASLERVRAHAMAMHNSIDLSSTVNIFFKELKALGITPMRCGVGEMQEETHTSDLVFTTADKQGELYELPGKLKHEGHPVVENMYNYWKLQEEYHPVLRGADINAYYRIIKSQMTLPDFPEYAKHYGNYFYFKEGFFFAWADEELSEEGLNICRRFTSVLSLTYKRYKDLKTAEANAREATIEAALEKVRGKAMAMHNSNDLSVTAGLVFTELRKLGISPIRTGVGLLRKGERKALAYGSIASGHADNLSLTGWVILDGHPTLSNQYDYWLRKEDYFPVLKGKLLKTYYEKLSSSYSYPLPDEHTENEQYGYFLMFTEGYMFCWSQQRYTEDEIRILKRFTSVIDLTFRRYMELQKSEANAREAVKQAALDRVRAEIASMRTISDLDRITPLIWNELNILGISFIRCGVFIMDESQQLIHTFLSTPDGRAIAAFHLPYDTPGRFPDLIDHWRNKKIYVSRWSEDDFLGIANTLLRQGAIATKEQYLGTLPKGGFYLHFLPFLQGLLYVGNTDQLGQDEIILIQHVADAFSTAYARYEDFNKLEAAKQQVDKTLVDLKQAQTQLVQSEKMASLGELTAGIAHEIQNPLNFVNNFSDVSNELLEEMKGELATGNMQQAIAIADDVRQNLEKILHHGKRADAIVKGMLQHSRTSSGQKEPTDINALADEYLRLAYHGLRAKEKSFNAKFETDFDQSIGKINIIPQEIGRVVLNLINNAFYAVTEKKKTEGEAYEPTVTVSTRNHPASADKGAGYVEINVSDNGIGISEVTRDKIFQPFFTTKPSGQGTGLGLSLAYDIITKGHGGDILVKSIPGKGSEFIIKLPAYASL